MSGLYQEDIKALAQLELAKELSGGVDREFTLDNPLCGDRVRVQLQLVGAEVGQAVLQVKGCILCRASANLIQTRIKGQDLPGVQQIADSFAEMLKGMEGASWPPQGWTALETFRPVGAHKSRHQCVLLPFKAVIQALTQEEATDSE